jgi:WD40 repeat protein
VGEQLAVRGRTGLVHPAAPHTVRWTASSKSQYSRLPDVVWSPDGRCLIDDADGRITIKNADTGQVLRQLPTEPGPDGGPIHVLAWPTPRTLVIESDGVVAHIDTDHGHQRDGVHIVRGINLKAVSTDGTKLAIVEDHLNLVIVDMRSGATAKLDCFAPNLRDVVFPPGDRHVLTSDQTGLVRWALDGRNVVAKTTWREPTWIAADPTGTYVTAVRVSGDIALFDARTLELHCQLTVDGTLQACAFDPAGEHLAVAGSNGLHLFRRWRRRQ